MSATRMARVLGQRPGWVVCDCDGGCGALLEVTDSMARMLVPVRCGSCEDLAHGHRPVIPCHEGQRAASAWRVPVDGIAAVVNNVETARYAGEKGR